MRAPRLPFSLLLPALDLALWVFLSLIPVTLYYFGFLADAQEDHRPVAVAQHEQLHVQPQEVAAQQLEVAMDWRSRTLMDINPPALGMETLVSIGPRWPEIWHPDAIALATWRALVYPLYALPAWWLAGIALDALFGRRRLHWLLFAGDIVLFLFCGLMAVAGSMISLQGDAADISRTIGCIVWSLLFAVAPVAWWRQRRRDARRDPLSGEAEPALDRLS
ncbi:hypothetical protein SAMN05421819_2245 [Bryocella elongata]|uniref:Uncharacterized protein n=1 Tax=Bryocella elongata TaxID=863522 RepID=A0A1H5YD14_9BACT|nr:hypothetical protein [Bryocella elongata]SEG21864.1 hypothetical protein SAMN05421819_2245 [Bryocella elongata]